MEELIATYLFQNKSCPLPGVGSLSVGDRTASFVLGEKLLHPPLPYISFSPAERGAEDFISFLSFQLRITKEEALKNLENYCSRLNNLDAYSELEIPHAGKFYVDAEGVLVFKQVHFQEALLPPVPAERIIHPDATHSIMVGDTERNSAIMAEYYSETLPAKKDRWWIPALVLALLAITAILIYFNTETRSGQFGNALETPAASQPKTYNTP